MRLLRTMMLGALGTATLLPLPLAWAETGAPVAGNAAARNAASGTSAPAAPAGTPTGAASPATGKGVTGDVTLGGATRPGMDGRTDDGMDDWRQAKENDRKAFLDARLAAIRAGLELTPQQDPLWAPVDAAVRELAKAHHSNRPHRMEGMDQPDAMSGTQRLKMRGARMIAVGQALGKLADAAGPLAESLSPEQRHRLPVLLRGMHMRRAMAQAFGIERMMGHGPRWRHRFADRDGMGRDGMGRGRMERDGMGPMGGDFRRDGRFGPRDSRFDDGDGMAFRHGGDRGWGDRDGGRED